MPCEIWGTAREKRQRRSATADKIGCACGEQWVRLPRSSGTYALHPAAPAPMSWASGVELDLNEPAEVEKQGAPVRFAWVDQREPPPEPAVVHGALSATFLVFVVDSLPAPPSLPTNLSFADTASFLEEITRVDEERDQPDTACAKRKRDDDAHGAASRAERTIERYYDHRLEEEGSITNIKKRRSEGTGGVTKLDGAASGRHSGFEVVEFQLVCPIASFDIKRKQGDALKAEVEKQAVKCRIPPFELKGSGVGVITVFTPLAAHSRSILPSGYSASSAHMGAHSEWPTGGRSRKEHPLTSRDDGIWRVCRPGHG